MKTLTIAFTFLMCSASYADNIPGPFWYSLSEKILAETQQWFSPESPKQAKAKVKKVKIQASPLKCEPAKIMHLPLKELRGKKDVSDSDQAA